MKLKLLFSTLLVAALSASAQTISIVGTGVNGWPPTNGPEITLASTDNIIYTVNDLVVTTGEVKFRQDFSWANNWGGSTFPNGNGAPGGTNIPTLAGTYDVTFNRLTGAYSFVGNTTAQTVELWGPAVDAQLGFGGPGVAMATSDEVNYTLSNFVFTSGNAYFRLNGNNNLTFGSTAFPSGVAVASGPTIPVTGREWYVTFNRTTGQYNFEFPLIGILGSALNGWNTDVDMNTTDGFNYSLQVALTTGAVKFRKNNTWDINWGGNDFPTGTATNNGNDINITTASTYLVQFEPLTGAYSFTDLLSQPTFSTPRFVLSSNPTATAWQVEGTTVVDVVEILDLSGKQVGQYRPNATSFSVEAAHLVPGMYLLKMVSAQGTQTLKAIKN